MSNKAFRKINKAVKALYRARMKEAAAYRNNRQSGKGIETKSTIIARVRLGRAFREAGFKRWVKFCM